jgi:hypothetical protein
MKSTPVIFACIFCMIQASGQKKGDSLFSDQSPLNIGLRISIKEVAQSKADSVYLPHQLYYKNASGTYDSIQASLKSRGDFRLKKCYFPPVWIKMDKKEIKGTIFEGNKKLKLVLPCSSKTTESNALVLKEYLCYKLYECITPYAFKTRLVNIDLTEEREKKDKQFQLKAFLIEDLDNTAKRFHAKTSESALNPSSLQDTASLRFSLFQYMISNIDLSMVYQHNAKLIVLENGQYISIPYDFDLSGLVDAPYAVVSQVGDEPMDAQTVRDRLYRGWCAGPEITKFVRQEFISKEAQLMAVPDQLKGELSDKEINGIKDYLESFFKILKNDNSFYENIVSKCRK